MSSTEHKDVDGGSAEPIKGGCDEHTEQKEVCVKESLQTDDQELNKMEQQTTAQSDRTDIDKEPVSSTETGDCVQSNQSERHMEEEAAAEVDSGVSQSAEVDSKVSQSAGVDSKVSQSAEVDSGVSQSAEVDSKVSQSADSADKGPCEPVQNKDTGVLHCVEKITDSVENTDGDVTDSVEKITDGDVADSVEKNTDSIVVNNAETKTAGNITDSVENTDAGSVEKNTDSFMAGRIEKNTDSIVADSGEKITAGNITDSVEKNKDAGSVKNTYGIVANSGEKNTNGNVLHCVEKSSDGNVTDSVEKSTDGNVVDNSVSEDENKSTSERPIGIQIVDNTCTDRCNSKESDADIDHRVSEKEDSSSLTTQEETDEARTDAKESQQNKKREEQTKPRKLQHQEAGTSGQSQPAEHSTDRQDKDQQEEKQICVVKHVEGGVSMVSEEVQEVTMETESDDDDCVVIEDEVVCISLGDSDDEVVITEECKQSAARHKQASSSNRKSKVAKVQMSPKGKVKNSGGTRLMTASGRMTVTRGHSLPRTSPVFTKFTEPTGSAPKSHSTPSAASAKSGIRLTQLLTHLKKSFAKKKIDVDKINAELEKSRAEADISIIFETPAPIKDAVERTKLTSVVAVDRNIVEKTGRVFEKPTISASMSVVSGPGSSASISLENAEALDVAAEKGRIDKIISDLEVDEENVDLDMSVESEPNLSINVGLDSAEQRASAADVGEGSPDKTPTDPEKSRTSIDLDMSVVSEPVSSMNICVDDSEPGVSKAEAEKSNASGITTDVTKPGRAEPAGGLSVSIMSPSSAEPTASMEPLEKYPLPETGVDQNTTAASISEPGVLMNVYSDDNSDVAQPALSDYSVTSSWKKMPASEASSATSLPDDMSVLHTHYGSTFIKKEIKHEPQEYELIPSGLTEVTVKQELVDIKMEHSFYTGEAVTDGIKESNNDGSLSKPEPVPLNLISYVNNPDSIQVDDPQSQQGSSLQVYMDIDEGGSVLGRDCIPSAEVISKETLGTDGGVLCLICKQRFPKEEINQHLSSDHSQRHYKCGLCRKIMDDKVKLLKHFKEQHNFKHFYYCLKCGLQIAFMDRARYHFKREHNLIGETFSSVVEMKEMKYVQKIVNRYAAYIENYYAIFGEEPPPHTLQMKDELPSADVPQNEEKVAEKENHKQSSDKVVSKPANVSELKDRLKKTIAKTSQLKSLQDSKQKCKLCKKLYTSVATVVKHLRIVHKKKKVEKSMYCVYVASQVKDGSKSQKTSEKDVGKEKTAGKDVSKEKPAFKGDKHRPYKCFKCSKTFETKLLCFNHVRYYHKVQNINVKKYMTGKDANKGKMSGKGDSKVKKVEMKKQMYHRKVNSKKDMPSLEVEKSNPPVRKPIVITKSQKMKLRVQLKTLRSNQSKKDEPTPSTSHSSSVKQKESDLPSTSTLQPEQLNKVYQCKLCGFFVGGTRRIPQLLFTHISKDHNVVRFSCKECTYCTNEEEVITKHVTTYHVCMQYQCMLCKTVCSSEKSVLQHMEAHHSSSSRSKINYQMYSREEGLHTKYDDMFTNFYQEVNLSSDHSNTLISQSSQTRCKLCGLVVSVHSSSPSLLEHHLVSEHRVSKYRCKGCSFSSSTESDVQVHLATCSARSTIPLKDRYEILDLTSFTTEIKPAQSESRPAASQTETKVRSESSDLDSSVSDDDSYVEILESSTEREMANNSSGAKRKASVNVDVGENKKKKVTKGNEKKKVGTNVKKSTKSRLVTRERSSSRSSVKPRYRCTSEESSRSSSSASTAKAVPAKKEKVFYCSFDGCQYESQQLKEKQKHEILHRCRTMYKCSSCKLFYAGNQKAMNAHLSSVHKDDCAFMMVSNDKGLTYYRDSDSDSTSDSDD